MSSKQMSTHPTRDVVVGVDGSPASANALRFAMRQAARSGGKVKVFHIIADYAPMAYPLPFDDLMEAARATLDATLHQAGVAGHRAGDDAGDNTVETHLKRGGVVRTLADAGRSAQTVVVGSDRRSAPMRLLTGNVSTGLAARSTVPVVSVPETWHADRPTGVVLVGVKHPDHSDALVAESFDVARQAGSKLVILHAWHLPAAYDGVVVSDAGTLAAWRARVESELEALVAPWRHSHADVEVELRVVHDHPAHAIVTASDTADELILLRRVHGVPVAAHLGSTARTVLLHAQCPVRIVPAVHAPVVPDQELEAAGVARETPTS